SQIEAHGVHLRMDYHNFKKNSLSVSDFNQCKVMADALNSIGHEVTKRDLVIKILNGLPYEYILRIITAFCFPNTSYLETRSFLFMFESQLAMFSGQHSQDSSIALMAKSTTNGSGQASYRGRGNGRYHYGSRPNQRRHHHTPSHAILSLALIIVCSEASISSTPFKYVKAMEDPSKANE
ncbi:hypothetical protein Leryth_002299, partial [Lithospermum erythrorhizon]